jgi:AcrR family transcriptional regulator
MLVTMSSGESDTRIRIFEATAQLLAERRVQSVRMRDIADAAGLSRQALYLHFGSRTELMVATTRYLDRVFGLEERLQRYRAATAGVEVLDAFVEFWGNYIPKIYGLATALLAARETDEAAAAAWADRMAAVRDGCRNAIEALERDGRLAPEWGRDEAIDLLWTMLSIRNWEHLTIDSGWAPDQYVDRMQRLTRRAFVRGAADE